MGGGLPDNEAGDEGMEEQSLTIQLPASTLMAMLADSLTAVVYLSDEDNRLKERFGIDRVVIRKNPRHSDVAGPVGETR